jgi:hypothetical protein
VLCSVRISAQRSTHSLQMATSQVAPATTPSTWSRRLPQKEQRTLAAASRPLLNPRARPSDSSGVTPQGYCGVGASFSRLATTRGRSRLAAAWERRQSRGYLRCGPVFSLVAVVLAHVHP